MQSDYVIGAVFAGLVLVGAAGWVFLYERIAGSELTKRLKKYRELLDGRLGSEFAGADHPVIMGWAARNCHGHGNEDCVHHMTRAVRSFKEAQGMCFDLDLRLWLPPTRQFARRVANEALDSVDSWLKQLDEELQKWRKQFELRATARAAGQASSVSNSLANLGHQFRVGLNTGSADDGRLSAIVAGAVVSVAEEPDRTLHEGCNVQVEDAPRGEG